MECNQLELSQARTDAAAKAVTIIIVTLLTFWLGFAIGFNEALDATFVDQSGRNCIAAEMYRPNDADAEKVASYGEWGNSNGRGGRVYCEDKAVGR